jgi:hypothetical protein
MAPVLDAQTMKKDHYIPEKGLLAAVKRQPKVRRAHSQRWRRSNQPRWQWLAIRHGCLRHSD